MEIGRDAHGIKSLNRHTLEQVVALSSDGILIADAQDRNLSVLYANPAYEALSGYSLEELAGRPWQLLRRDGESESELMRLRAAIGCAEACRLVIPDLRKDGTSWVSQLIVEPLRNARGDLKYFLCIQRPTASMAAETAGEFTGPSAESSETSSEISLLHRELGRGQKIATLDRLDPSTGLLRPEYFQDMLSRDLAISRREQRFVTLLLFSIVELDAYRQTFGVKAADSCQRMIGAQIMRVLRRAGDLCARYDDSTLVASVLGQSPEEIRPLAQQIADNVRQLSLHNPRGKRGRHITIQSAVVGCAPGTAEDAEALVARALAELRTGNAGLRAAQVS